MLSSAMNTNTISTVVLELSSCSHMYVDHCFNCHSLSGDICFTQVGLIVAQKAFVSEQRTLVRKW